MRRWCILAMTVVFFGLTVCSADNVATLTQHYNAGEYAEAEAFCEVPDDFLALAELYKQDYKLDKVLETYERGAEKHGDLRIYKEWIKYLLALEIVPEAGAVLENAMKNYPDTPEVLELKAEQCALGGNHIEALKWIKLAIQNGAKPLDWLERPFFSRMGALEPYIRIISAKDLLNGIDKLEPGRQIERLKLLSAVIEPDIVDTLVKTIIYSYSPSVKKAGIRALGELKTEASEGFYSLLNDDDPRLRRMVLLEIREIGIPEMSAIIERYIDTESAPGNYDLAEVVSALLKAKDSSPEDSVKLLEGIRDDNTYSYLAMDKLSKLYTSMGMHEKAAEAAIKGRDGKPIVNKDALAGEENTQASLEAYWECMEREDLREMKELIQYHEYVEKIDASIYGLPVNDFDDHRMLSIAERLFLREKFERDGNPLPTEGQQQYPREIRHFLRTYYRDTGLVPDCSGILVERDSDIAIRTIIEDGAEVKLREDTGGDNEVNIAVNPYNQQYIVATSNDYDGTNGNDLYYSSNWGESWTYGNVPHTAATCDPVSYYNQTGGQDVVYHSYLTFSSLEMKYSTNNGASWNACAQITTAGQDRQDHAIDTDPDSGCFNRIYLAYQNGEQRIVRSTGATFPYCQSWGAVHTSATGSTTIGSAIVVSPTFGQPAGTNSIAHNFFTGYGSGYLYEDRSSDCGASWAENSRYALNNAGDFEWGIPSTCTRQVYFYPQADNDRQPLSAFRNNIYIVWNDLSSSCTPPGCSGNTTCNNDIFLARAVPNDRDDPTSWTFEPKVNLTAPAGPIPSDLYTDEFYPSVSVDQADGSIYVSFYRTGSGSTGITPRQTQVHYYAAKSIDGGVTWELHRVTDLPTDESGSGADSSMQWGDYTWNDVINGVCYPAWTDRRELNDEDIWSAKMCSEPSHWSEREPTYTPPITLALPGAPLQINVSWTAPDIYWGDGGENNALRKYQLWVDGVLEEDNILWTATSTSWTAADCSTPHSLYIKAINQCGVSKNYAAANNVLATGCCSDNPEVDVTPDGPFSFCIGTSQLLTANLTGGNGTITYQWTIDGSDIPGANSSTYTPNDSGTHVYNCKAKSNFCADFALDPFSVMISWQDVPVFTGIQSVTNAEGATCTLELAWNAALTVCPNPIVYNIYRSDETGGPYVLIASVSDLVYNDANSLTNGEDYFYMVRAEDSVNGEESNSVELSGIPTGPGSGSQEFLNENFDASGIPGTWTVVDGGTTNDTWFADNVSDPMGCTTADPASPISGNWVAADSDCAGSGVTMDEQLITPVIDMSLAATVTLEFDHNLNYLGGEFCEVDVMSSNTGGSWTNVGSWAADSVAHINIDITTEAAGANDVQIRWHYHNAIYEWWWYVDNVVVSGFVNNPCTTGSGCANNPTVNVTPDGPLTLCTGTGQLLSADLTGGTGPFSYQWTEDSVDIPFATGSTYTANSTGTHNYNCKVTGLACPDSTWDPTGVDITWQSYPDFAGVDSVINPANATCTLNVSWIAATTYCGGTIYYNIYRSDDSGGPWSLITTVTGLNYSDTMNLTDGEDYFYKVNAYDDSNSIEDPNTLEDSGIPSGPGSGSQEFFNEDFEASGIPGTWTIFDGGTSTDTWYTDNSGDPGGCGNTDAAAPCAGNWAQVDSDCAGSVDMDEELITPAFDMSTASTAFLTFDHYFRMYSAEVADVDIRSTGGTGGSWMNVASWTGTSTANAASEIIDITTEAAGYNDVQIRFHYYNANFEWTWSIDNVIVNGDVNNPCTTAGGCAVPTAGFTSTSPVCDGVGISFTDTSVAGGTCAITGWDWDFGDLGSSTAQNPIYTYATAGTYTVTLTVTQDDAQQDIFSNTAVVNPLPGAPVITDITDNDACLASGITIAYTAGTDAVSHDLYDETGLLVAGIGASPILYTPVDAASHNYYARAINTCGTADSLAVAGQDADDTPTVTIDSIVDDNPLASSTITITFSGGAGAVSFDLWVDSAETALGVISPYQHTPGDCDSHDYVVRAVNGTCFTDSAAYPFADSGCVIPGVGEVPDGDDTAGTATSASKSGNDVVLAHGAAADATHYNLYRGTIASIMTGVYDHNFRANTGDICEGDNSGDMLVDDTGALIDGNSYYYLIGANNQLCEGSLGDDSANTQRPHSSDRCGLIVCP